MTALTDDLRSEIIIQSATARAELELRETRAVFRKLFGSGGESYLQELRESDRIDSEMRMEPPPAPEARKGLKRWWGWKKRGR